MEIKKIVIIGGGISGLAVLHFLIKRFGNALDIRLYEANNHVGGTVYSQQTHLGVFEQGPNGFLDNQPATLELIEDLHLNDALITANTNSKIRFIYKNNQLLKVPASPIDFIQTPLLSPLDKIKFIAGFFKKNISTNQSIFDYVAKRFGNNVAINLVDPFLTGVYAGNIHRLHMASAFPSSLFKKSPHQQKKQMRSLSNGMGQIIKTLYQRYDKYIQLNTPIESLENFNSTLIICSLPAYQAKNILKNTNPALAKALSDIYYAPICVQGFIFKKSAFNKNPEGFGYLIPSSEKQEVLGVLIENNVFTGRTDDNHILLRVMIGGAHHPDITQYSTDTLKTKALEHLNKTYGLKEQPVEHMIKIWEKGIPQYELNYPQIKKDIHQSLEKTPHIHLCANYLNGISFNDCIKNAKELAQNILFC